LSIKETLKIMMIKTSNVTLTEVVKRLNEKNMDGPNFKPETIQNLSKKINKGTLRYDDAEKIAEVLGYKIEWIPKENDN
jgi:GatB domain.